MSAPEPVRWTVVEDEAGRTFRWGYEGDDLVAEWVGLLTLRATRSGKLTDVRPAAGAPQDHVDKTLHGIATAFLRAQRHEHALHASAVALRGEAIVCVGVSGLGKSTMAEQMCRRPGVELLADDIAEVEVASSGEVRILPSEAAVWLATGASTTKAPVTSSTVAVSPARLRCIVSLVFDDSGSSLELREVRGADAVSALMPSIVRFERTAPVWVSELALLSRLTEASRVVEARRTRRLGADRVAEALLGLLEARHR